MYTSDKGKDSLSPERKEEETEKREDDESTGRKSTMDLNQELTTEKDRQLSSLSHCMHTERKGKDGRSQQIDR